MWISFPRTIWRENRLKSMHQNLSERNGRHPFGRPQIAVDAVVVIGEHGVYPRTPRGNFMYPRWRYFDEITRAMREENRVLPIYQDKYFAFDWADAKRTYDRVREMKIPLLCGSTVPLTWQRPPLELPRGIRYSELLTTSYSDIEEHAYHGIELLQAMAERRAGGETGVAQVRWCKEKKFGRKLPRVDGPGIYWMPL